MDIKHLGYSSEHRLPGWLLPCYFDGMAGYFSWYALSFRLIDVDCAGHRGRLSQAGLVWTESILHPLSQFFVMNLNVLYWFPLTFQRLLSWSFSLLMALTGLMMATSPCSHFTVHCGLLLIVYSSSNDEGSDIFFLICPL
ncbi:hypothetical protein TNCT_722521 [Trichonephila clavata]|uniref:Uncharacterized protein n=1 Tax=Trichonephila clavata TaxID=2740835 RepID=A0A8X6FED0_TRICU|nr:hypothetical protein TNCT_722521 [Trichonephila clavata]